MLLSYYTLCSEKNTHSHFLSYLHELFLYLNKNCSEYTQGLIDSDNVKIRYSPRLHYVHGIMLQHGMSHMVLAWIWQPSSLFTACKRRPHAMAVFYTCVN